MITRNPTPFLKRIGLVDEPARPKPRIAPDALLVHTIPIHPPKPSAEMLIPLNGEPPADRNGTFPWPGQQ